MTSFNQDFQNHLKCPHFHHFQNISENDPIWSSFQTPLKITLFSALFKNHSKWPCLGPFQNILQNDPTYEDFIKSPQITLFRQIFKTPPKNTHSPGINNPHPNDPIWRENKMCSKWPISRRFPKSPSNAQNLRVLRIVSKLHHFHAPSIPHTFQLFHNFTKKIIFYKK